ncbi:MAG: hypothetical protein IPL87_02545 [Candidatus Moraniibacteriota bacterium]|nr:MAG: hypothetical protein IPL87_02545 [Candidatus Moranbacteria bacterium]
MISNKVLAVSAIAIGTALASGFALVGNVSADNIDPRNSIIDRLVSKFNLNKSEVENVFQEERAMRQEARQKEMTARLEDQLVQAVKDGKISEEQKALVLKKHEEMRAARMADFEKRRTLTKEERRSESQKRRNDMKAWLSENNIPEDIMGMGMRGEKGSGMGHRGGMMR